MFLIVILWGPMMFTFVTVFVLFYLPFSLGGHICKGYVHVYSKTVCGTHVNVNYYVVYVNYFEITFQLMKQYDFWFDGNFCCIGFSWNSSTAMCESKDIKDITMIIMAIIAIINDNIITCFKKCGNNIYRYVALLSKQN